MVFNYNIRFVRLNVVMCVFLLEDLKRFGFFRRLQNYKRGQENDVTN